MKIFLILLMVFLGVILSVHLTMNAQVGVMLKNSKMANALFWSIGAITALIVGATAWDVAVLEKIKTVPFWLLTAGAMGALLVFGIAWTIPQIGAGPAFVLMIAGQVLTGMIFSHFGLMGSPVEPFSLMKGVGVLLLLAGVSIITFVK